MCFKLVEVTEEKILLCTTNTKKNYYDEWRKKNFLLLFFGWRILYYIRGLNNKWYPGTQVNIIIPVRYAPGTGTVFYFDGTGRYGGSGVKSTILPWRSVAVVGRSSFLECFKNKKCINNKYTLIHTVNYRVINTDRIRNNNSRLIIKRVKNSHTRRKQ